MSCFCPLSVLVDKNGFKPLNSYPHNKKIEILQDLNVFYFKQLAQNVEDEKLRKKLEIETRIREGAIRLLDACLYLRQQLEAERNLILSSEGMIICVNQIMKNKSDNLDKSNAKLVISNIEIPLMWKMDDHFKNKGDNRKFVLFCLLKTNSQVFATEIAGPIDRSFTDISFDQTFIFDEIEREFCLKIEIFSHLLEKKYNSAVNSSFSCNDLVPGRSIQQKIGIKLAGSNFNRTPKFSKVCQITLHFEDSHSDPKSYLFDGTLFSGSKNTPPLYGFIRVLMSCKPYAIDFIKLKETAYLRISKDGENFSERRLVTLEIHELELWAWRKSKPVFYCNIKLCENFKINVDCKVTRSFIVYDGTYWYELFFNDTECKEKFIRIIKMAENEAKRWKKVTKQPSNSHQEKPVFKDRSG